jgi:hypothetical protein
MLNLSILCARCERNYSSCTDRSSENRRSSSGKKRDRVKLRNHENWWFSEFQPHLNVNVLFCRFFSNLTLCMTKLRVQVLSFPDFTDISNTLLLLAASTLIILLSEMLKYSKRQFPILFFVWRKTLNLQDYSLCRTENFKIIDLFWQICV